MLNHITLEGYVTTNPMKKPKYEGEGEYVRFDIVHYSKFGGSMRMACVSTNLQVNTFVLSHVYKNDRVIVVGTYNQYRYKNPAGEDKITHSVLLDSHDSVKLISVSKKEAIIPKQKIGFPEEEKRILLKMELNGLIDEICQ